MFITIWLLSCHDSGMAESLVAVSSFKVLLHKRSYWSLPSYFLCVFIHDCLIWLLFFVSENGMSVSMIHLWLHFSFCLIVLEIVVTGSLILDSINSGRVLKLCLVVLHLHHVTLISLDWWNDVVDWCKAINRCWIMNGMAIGCMCFKVL